MSAVLALDTIRAACRVRADMKDTLFWTDAEIDSEIHRSYAEFYDLILECAGPETFMRGNSFLTASGTAGYPLYESGTTDALVYKLGKVLMLDQGEFTRLEPTGDVGAIVAQQVSGVGHGKPQRCRLVGPIVLRTAGSEMTRRLLLDPVPDGVYQVVFTYVPVPPDLTTGSAQNLFPFAGWEEWVICDVAAKMAEKEESFDLADRLLRRRSAAESRIRFNAKTFSLDGAGGVRDIDSQALPYQPWNL